MNRMSHAKSVKSNSVSFIGHCGTAALSRTGRKGRKRGRGGNNCIHHCTLILGNDTEQSMWAPSDGRNSRLWGGNGFWQPQNKSRLSVSTVQVQTPTAVAGGDALAGRMLERPPQRKTRRALSEKLPWWVCERGNEKRCLDVHNDNREIHEGWKIRVI